MLLLANSGLDFFQPAEGGREKLIFKGCLQKLRGVRPGNASCFAHFAMYRASADDDIHSYYYEDK